MEDRPGHAMPTVPDEPQARANDVDPLNGLSETEVQSRIRASAVNGAPPSTGRSFGEILRANVLTRFNAILGSLFVIALINGPIQDALFGVVLVANTAIGIVQELRSKRTLDRLAILAAPKCHAVRSGRLVDLPFEEIVLDDVLELSRGDQVAVDGQVLQSEGLEVDESLLTGEAEAIAKSPGVPVLSGTFVVAGWGRIRATRVGASSYASELEAQARRFSLIRSELQQGTNEILRLVTWIMIPTAIALFITQLLRIHQSSGDALRGSVAGVAAMVPEGLVLLTSVAFAVGALRLARHRVLVQEIAAVEGLARVDVLCIDKTGTLTEPGLRFEEIELVGNRSQREVEHLLAALAASDPAPNATIAALSGIGEPGPGEWRVQSRVPFSSARKWSAVEFGDRGWWILGAPQVVLPERDEVTLARAAEHERAARRVLVLAASSLSLDSAELPDSVEPVALVVFAERLRADASSTIHYLRDQGMTVKVLSGDAPHTVSEVADRLSIPSPGAAVDATTLHSEADLKAALDNSNLIGRVRPEQKLSAVELLQSEGHVVAMVGDGVNDVQALKQADLGIAMGSGSQSSRSVARVVLLDSAFSAVPQMLAEGRKVIANIERVASLFVTKTVYAALLAIAVVIVATPYPFFPRHLTIVSALTIGIPGFFLAFGSNAPRAVPGFTGRVLRFTVPAGVLTAVATFVSYAVARAAPDTSIVQARTTAVIAVFIMALWVLILVARPFDLLRLLLVGSMAAIFVLFLAVPWSRRVFSLQLPPSPVILIAITVSIGSILALTFWRSVYARSVKSKGRPAYAETEQKMEEDGRT